MNALDGVTSLREAVATANANAGADEIVFDASLNGQTINLSGGQLVLSGEVEIDGVGRNITIDLSAADSTPTVNDANGVRAFVVQNGVSATIRGVTIQGGDAAGGGGAIYNLGDLVLDRVALRDNSASMHGGAIWVDPTGTLEVIASTIDDNHAGSGYTGGGISGMFKAGESLRIVDSTISNNTAGGGGGLKIQSIAIGVVANIINTTFSGNSAAAAGAINVQNQPDVSGTDDAKTHLTLVNSTVTDNEATLTSSYGVAGGIYNINLTSTYSGGVYDAVTMYNTIVAGNTAYNTAYHEGWGSLGGATGAVSAYNLVQQTYSGIGVSNGSSGNQVGVDPKLGPLANNGGPTKTHALRLDSPAIDRGNSSAPGIPAYDQRGSAYDRTQDGNADGSSVADIGAYEALDPIVVDTTSDVVSAVDGVTSLREAVTAANATAEPNRIVFHSSLNGQTINLSSGQLVLSKDVAIEGIESGVTIDMSASDPSPTVHNANGARAFVVQTGVSAAIRGVKIQGGDAAGGGGAIYNLGDLTLDQVTLRDNSTNLHGGAIWVDPTGTLEVIASTIEDNHAGTGYTGGGIAGTFKAGESLRIVDSAIIGNTAGNGGGLKIQSVGVGMVANIINTTFSANSAGSGGAISVQNSGSTKTHLTLINSTITDNEATDPSIYGVAGGIYNVSLTNTYSGGLYDAVTMYNTIVAGNTAYNTAYHEGWGSLGGATGAVSGYNLVQQTYSGIGVSNGSNGNQVGVDPKLDTLADNGGPTKTHALQKDSPAIDKGSDSYGGAADQRGMDRPVDVAGRGNSGSGIVDIGAYEAGIVLGVAESAVNGTIIGEVVDPASPVGDWEIVSGNTGGAFDIDPATGEISVANSSALNYATTPNYTLTVRAMDGSAVVAMQRLTIYVLDPTINVNVTSDLADATPIGDGIVDVDLATAGYQISLRAALQESNALGASTIIYLDDATYALTRTGAEDGTTNYNDLDIRSEVVIVGASLGDGAGQTIVDASGLGDRVFDVWGDGSLNLLGLTVTGGVAPAANYYGGGIHVANGGALVVNESAIVNNYAASGGGGIANFGVLTMSESVITGNSSRFGGGVYSPTGSSSIYVASIIGNNQAVNTSTGSAQPTYADVQITGGTSYGDNLLTSQGASPFVNGVNGDVINGNVDYIVTSIVDEVNSGDDDVELTLREAVLESNQLLGAETIWVPAWFFSLTLDSSSSTDEFFGEQDDLDVLDNLTIVGIGEGMTNIDIDYARTYAADEVFALHPFHRDHSVSLSVDRLTRTGEATPTLTVVGSTKPAGAPTLSEGLAPPKLPFTSGGTGAPQIAELTRTAGPGQSVTISGYNLSAYKGDNTHETSPNPNVNNIGSDITVLVYGQAADGTTVFAEATILRVDGKDVNADGNLDYQVAMIVLPESLPAWSTYMLWVGNANGWSEPQLINKSEAWWIGPDKVVLNPSDAATVTTSIHGRNLAHDNQEGTTSDVKVYLEAYNSSDSLITGHQATVTAVNPYKVDFVVPENIVGVSYFKVWVSNGHGGEYGWSSELRLNVGSVDPLKFATVNIAVGSGTTPAPGIPALQLNGSGEYKADSDIDGTLDIQEWMDHYYNTNTTLVLPSGTVLVDEYVRLHAGVHLRGGGATGISKTTLKADAAGNFAFGSGKLLFDAWQASNSAISQMEIDASGLYTTVGTDKSPILDAVMVFNGATTVENFTMDNVNINAGVNPTLDIRNTNRVRLTNLDIIGQQSTFYGLNQAKIDNVHVRMTNHAITALHFKGGNGQLSITNSSARDYDVNDTTDGWGMGRFISFQAFAYTPENIYIGDNDTYDLTPHLSVSPGNVGEQILFESGVTPADTSIAVGRGTVVNTVAKTIQFTTETQIYAQPSVPYPYGWLRAQIAVIDGKGLGQTHRIDGSKLTLVNTGTGTWTYSYSYEVGEWAVLPDASSTMGILALASNVTLYKNDLDFKEDARTNTNDAHNNYDSPFSTVGIMVGGSVNFIADGNRVQEGYTGLFVTTGFPDATANLDRYAIPNFWFTAVNNEFGTAIGRDLGAQSAKVHRGVEVMHSGAAAGVPTLGMMIRDNAIEAMDVTMDNGRFEKGAGLITHGYEGYGNTADNTGPSYVTFEGNDVTATQGYLHDALWTTGHGSSGGPNGAGYVAEGVPEDLVFYNNEFDSGVASTPVEMNYNLYTDFTDLVTTLYPGAMSTYRPGQNTVLDGAGVPNVPTNFQFHVLKNNVYKANGTLLAPDHDFGFDSGHPSYNAANENTRRNVVLAPQPTIHLAVKAGEGLSGLAAQIWGSELLTIDFDTVSNTGTWLTLGTDAYNSSDNSWSIPFSISSIGLSVGRHTAMITAIDFTTNLEIELTVILDVL